MGIWRNLHFGIFFFIGVISFGALSEAIYQYKRGFCEPFTFEFLAGLIQREARHIIFPQSRPASKTLRFDLYTRANPYERQLLQTGDPKALLHSNFNNSWPLRLVWHGWSGQTKTCSNAAIKDAYLERGDYNVILVDWTDYSFDVNYFRVVTQITDIARQFNEFTAFLELSTGIRYEDMYLIAHSMSCHIAGVAGRLIKPRQYGVLYALDPAGPGHGSGNLQSCLAPSDAAYVESIHTDATFFGYRNPLGHAAFYVNWGLGQSHCPNSTSLEPDFTCDHFAALYYFAESLLQPRSYGAVRCKSMKEINGQRCFGCKQGECEAEVFMGGEPAEPKRGIFYLSTKRHSPYGLGGRVKMLKPQPPTIERV